MRQAGIAIHTGPLMLGTIGENQRIVSIVITDTVNTASRLEKRTKEMHTDIIVSAESVRFLQEPEKFSCYSMEKPEVGGKTSLVAMYGIS